MDQQQYRQIPPPATESYGKRLWHLWGPIVMKWAISFGVTMAAVAAYSFTYMSTHYETTMGAAQSEEQMANLYIQIMEGFLRYTTLVEGAAALVTIPVMLILFHRDRIKEKLKGIVPNRKAPLWKYSAEILMALAVSLGLNNLIMIGNLSAVSQEYTETMEAFYSAPLILQILCLAILIPISEELIFRGLLYKRLRERGTFIQAALYSAVVFGLLHMNLVQMLYAFFLGLMLAYIYEKYGSIKAPIAAHMAMNLLSVLATEYRLFEWLGEDIMRIGIVTVVCAAVASTMFVLIQRIDEKPDIPGPSGENEHLAAV